jgi:hypothetical protein
MSDLDCDLLRRRGYRYATMLAARSQIPPGMTTNGAKVTKVGPGAGQGRHWTYRGQGQKISIREAFCLEDGKRLAVYKLC